MIVFRLTVNRIASVKITPHLRVLIVVCLSSPGVLSICVSKPINRMEMKPMRSVSLDQIAWKFAFPIQWLFLTSNTRFCLWISEEKKPPNEPCNVTNNCSTTHITSLRIQTWELPNIGCVYFGPLGYEASKLNTTSIDIAELYLLFLIPSRYFMIDCSLCQLHWPLSDWRFISFIWLHWEPERHETQMIHFCSTFIQLLVHFFEREKESERNKELAS